MSDSAIPFYGSLYDRLYRLGYHRDGATYSHAQRLCDHALAHLSPTTALDIGASLGWAVGYLSARGVKAVGVDVSPTAVRRAAKLGRDVRLASATELPFPSAHFDLVMSTDCLEHLRPDDVDRAVDEAVRVSRRWLAMKINPRPDRNGWWRLMAGTPLHLTLMSLKDWVRKFEERGCELVHVDREHEEFVLRRVHRTDAGIPSIMP